MARICIPDHEYKERVQRCAVLLELARVLAARPHRNTIRLIAFGAEEILSLGSAEYVRTHREELTKHGAFVCDFDVQQLWTETFGGWNAEPEKEVRANGG